MKKRFSSRKIIIPSLVLITIISVFMATYFFTSLRRTFAVRQGEEAFHHIEELAQTTSETVRLKFQANWQTAEAISIFCETIKSQNWSEVEKFFIEKKYQWNVARINVFTEDGSCYNEKGEKVQNSKASDFIKLVKDMKKVYVLEGDELFYIKGTKSPLAIDGKEITAVSTSIKISNIFDSIGIKPFNGDGTFLLVDNNGKIIAESKNSALGAVKNIFTYLKDYEISIKSQNVNSISQSLTEGKLFNGLIKNHAGDQAFYLVCYPIEPHEKYEPTRCHLVFRVPVDVVNSNHSDFSNYITKISSILILMICILMLMVFLLAYKSKSRSIENLMEEQEQTQQERLKTALVLAEQSNVAKTKFLSSMSHDIRTPLNAIINMADFVIQYRNNPVEFEYYLSVLKNSSNHLMKLINNILDMSTIESGNLIIKQDPFDLMILVQDVTNIIEPECKKKRITLHTETQSLEHILVVGDKLNIQRILINLLSNAVKFTPEGGKIMFSAIENKSASKGRGEFCFIVEDTGCGIKDTSTVFQPFIREYRADTDNIEGTGLGLAITKNLIDAMEGSIEVESQVNKGTKFTINLIFPIYVETEVATEEIDLNTLVQDFGGIKALVVEDNYVNRKIMGVLLQKLNIQVDFAENGQQALEKFTEDSANKYDLIYMDIQMPELDGYETTKAIRSNKKNQGNKIPIIAMTANVFDSDIEKCRKAGMNGHFGKPIDAIELAFVTNEVLTKKGTQDFIHKKI